ncbi:hypothetical protein KUM39_00365 [Streptomyces sp. J2-1]|uniref:hypothetical protein n=1 Tax=Streptomyces corallincola TaxID=2851888 RepID=UPI001C382650|nr:hypothetical protein [Streptomyces corallincola]MBV2352821.1 hypothetical protein [Streptomyces corallincola]
MAETDEEAVAADDALYVLTAVLLTPAQFPSVLGDDYPEACASLGLAPRADGYGLVIGQDGTGARWTVVIDDVSLVAVAIASWDCGMEYDLSPDERSVVAALPGWPLAVAVSAPNVPAPHDPAPEISGGPALTPPDATSWGAAQRRLGADEIALQWAVWREQLGKAFGTSPAETEPASGGTAEAGPTTATAAGSAPSPNAHSVKRALAEAHAYIDSPPPLGRVRSSFAPGDARTLRADGPGWSIVARTDDIAFVLLDEKPREVLPVGRGPELPGLLEALDRLAVRPN